MKSTGSPAGIGESPGRRSIRPSDQVRELSMPELSERNFRTVRTPELSCSRRPRRKVPAIRASREHLPGGYLKPVRFDPVSACQPERERPGHHDQRDHGGRGVSGRPMKGTPPMSPSGTPLPGFIAILREATEPSAATADTTSSSSPSATPPEVRTRSCDRAAWISPSLIRVGSSGTIPKSVTSNPSPRNRDAQKNRFES